MKLFLNTILLAIAAGSYPFFDAWFVKLKSDHARPPWWGILALVIVVAVMAVEITLIVAKIYTGRWGTRLFIKDPESGRPKPTPTTTLAIILIAMTYAAFVEIVKYYLGGVT